ncbi:MAG: nucleotide exchange factor GrpE [Verrucomicrobiota bacterium]|nr:nucleotide exchange factor GrpE [Limisphaera sp.]MDW8381679.1 nucleotide exchange factor GrpE [Verrucomicrobiota bacterium]
MEASQPLRLNRWPFWLADVLLVATAAYWILQANKPLSAIVIASSTLCMLTGAILAVLPYWLEYRAFCRRWEAATLAEGLRHARDAEAVARRIAEATDNWQAIQDQAARTAAQAREVAERMAAELRDFTAFLQKANDSEKATLRLEVEKLRRAEGEWLQVLVWILDHVFALYTAGLRSGQPRLIEQLTQFQNHCRDAARRLGVVPFVVPPGEPFDPQRHQTPDGQTPPPGAVVSETLATGIHFQGRLVRPAIVNVSVGAGASTDAEGPSCSRDSASSESGPSRESADGAFLRAQERDRTFPETSADA